MSAIDWLHCNKCFIKYQNGVQLYLTECQHIVCQICVAKIVPNNNKCIVCQKTTKTLLLSNKLDADTLSFFHPATDMIDRLKMVVSFQSRNSTSFSRHLLHKYMNAKNQIAKLYKTITDLKSELSKFKRGGDISMNSFASSTPRSNINDRMTPNWGNMSMSTIRGSPGSQLGPGRAVRVLPTPPMQRMPNMRSSHIAPVHKDASSRMASMRSIKTTPMMRRI